MCSLRLSFRALGLLSVSQVVASEELDNCVSAGHPVEKTIPVEGPIPTQPQTRCALCCAALPSQLAYKHPQNLTSSMMPTLSDRSSGLQARLTSRAGIAPWSASKARTSCSEPPRMQNHSISLHAWVPVRAQVGMGCLGACFTPVWSQAQGQGNEHTNIRTLQDIIVGSLTSLPHDSRSRHDSDVVRMTITARLTAAV